MIRSLIAGSAGVFFSLPVMAETMQLNMTPGVTAVSQDVYGLHMTILYICIVIGVVVFGAMFWAIFHHRKSKGAKPASFHESTKVEIIWTVIPFIILIAMAVPATKTLIAMEDTSKSDVTILVTGSQWKWHYSYFDQDVEYYSHLATSAEQISNQRQKRDNYLLEVDYPLVLPVGQKVRFLITSQDVIHSWWVPAFAVKKDANPGFINEAWTRIDKPGIYRGQCAELCGKDHGFMPIVVIAKPQAEYEEWLQQIKITQRKAKEEEQRLLDMEMTMDELMTLGEKTYVARCAMCHQANGQGLPGAFPALAGEGVSVDPKRKLEHISVVVHGKNGTAMQAFGPQLSLKELAAVITYERNAWGNDTGEVIQAAEVQAIKNGQQL
ncbi:cytochrome c oxidase subunit II [Photobacterium leiognathi]|uniref:Cytochrome c oxidase subunit 2 n=1 Tax=Photobacterium leiognathi subsp. mandapamensis TaxID=48408 RepID=A0A2T3KXT1_PHOLD|nr:cytochrome c oxidase subunit II [Photobacterium leiognathi]PSU99467.1 cytochrome c oxidase subunit II [Photobacterium leiognathi subsp. mandapamensis]PSV12436.1 cytochrome c oxidase subunit II [Photobacterium leiognathi subsp. mandapamensis]PSW52663.1 cytochrome c oxidase subunit II [Photobacterium leiognathi subsp. mandapamensis]GAA05317.1 cytochrome c oxidase, subunit II [Photobacterium leiognathi subsp. mandapamensis svers.1.1.]